MTPSNPTETPSAAFPISTLGAPAAAGTKKTDPGKIFFILVSACYLLYVAISASLKVITDKLETLQADLQEGVKLQGYMNNTMTTKTGKPGEEKVVLGGPDTDHGATARAEEILAYLRSIGMDPHIKLPESNIIALTDANVINNSLNTHVDLTKQSATTDSAKANSIQTSANATLELSTTMLKTLTNALLALAQAVR